MKKLALAAVLAASLSAPVMAADVNMFPWPWSTTAKVASVAKFMPLSRLVVVGGLTYQNPDYTVPDGWVVNPTLMLLPQSAVTLNGSVVSFSGGQGFNALQAVVGATCVIQGTSTNLSASTLTGDALRAQMLRSAHIVVKATCTK
jgi:opacity protein-like surface antigen